MHVVVKSASDEKEAFLVDVLPRSVPADPALIRRYYGSDAPIGAFAIFRVARLVFKVTTGGYYIVTDSPSSQRFWRFYGNQTA